MPVAKRIWTPSWALFSGGYVITLLAIFYILFDIFPFKRLAFPLVVIGMKGLDRAAIGAAVLGA